MRLDEAAWDELTRGSPIRRAGHAGLRRNVAVALGSWLATQEEPDADAVAALEEALGDPEPLVRAHAAWALSRGATRLTPFRRTRAGHASCSLPCGPKY